MIEYRPTLSRLAQVPMSATQANANRPISHPDPIDLSVGEPDDGPDAVMLERAARHAARFGGGYTPPAGLGALRSAIADAESQRCGQLVAPSEVVVTAGGKQALAEVVRALVDPGDEVVVLAPYWPSYLQQIDLAGGRARVVPAREDGTPDVDAARECVGANTRVVLLNDPVNPTSSMLDSDALDRLAARIEASAAWLVIDAVYRDLAFDVGGAHPFARHPQLRARTIVVDSFSKSHALTGARVGYAIAPPRLVEAVARLVAATTTCVSARSQCEALAALEVGGAALVRRRAAARRRAALVVERLRGEAGLDLVVPAAGVYAFPRVPGCWADGAALAHDLRTDDGVVVCPGAAFGVEDRIRLSTTVDEPDLERALARIVSRVRRGPSGGGLRP